MVLTSSLLRETKEVFEGITSDEAKKAAARTASIRGIARDEQDRFAELDNLPSPSNPNESAAFEKYLVNLGYEGEQLSDLNERNRDDAKSQLDAFLLSASDDLQELSEERKDIEADEWFKSGEEANRIRVSAFEMFKRNGMDSSNAQTLAYTVDWLPFLGDASGFEDALVSYKNGHMKWAAFEATLATAGLAPFVGDVIQKGLKEIAGKYNPNFQPVAITSEGIAMPVEEENLINNVTEMFAGEKSTLAKSRKGTFVLENEYSGKLDLEELEIKMAVEAGEIKTAEGLDSSKDMWEDFKIQLKEENGIDLNTFRGAGSGSSGNIIADIKSMDDLTKAKVKEKLNEMWVKTGWTVGSKNKFFTEIDDSIIINDPDKYFDFEKFVETYGNIVSSNFFVKPMKLEEVLYHPKLYEAYPELRNLAVSFDDGISDEYGGFYARDGRFLVAGGDGKSPAQYEDYATVVMSARNHDPEDLLNKNLKDIESGRRAFVSTLLHEIQHAIQHIEFGNASATWKWQQDNSQRLLENIDARVKNIDEMLLDPLSPKRKEDLLAQKLDLQFKSDKIKSMDLQNNPKGGVDSYYKTQTEVEARNVQERAFYDMNERYNKSPYDTLTTYAKGINGEEIIRRAATDSYGVLDKQKYRDLMDKFREVSSVDGHNDNIAYNFLYKKRPYAEYQVNSPAYTQTRIHGQSITGLTKLYAVPLSPSMASNTPKLDYDTTYKALESGHNFISDLLRQETAKLTTIPKTIKPSFSETIGGLEESIKNIKTDDAYYNRILNNIDEQAVTRQFPMEIEEAVDYDITGLKGGYWADKTDVEFPEVTERTVGKQSNFEVLPSASSTEPASPLEIGVNKFNVDNLEDPRLIKNYTKENLKDTEEFVKNSNKSTAGGGEKNLKINTPVQEGSDVAVRLNLSSRIDNTIKETKDKPNLSNRLQTIHPVKNNVPNYNNSQSYMPYVTVENGRFDVNQKNREEIVKTDKKNPAASVLGKYTTSRNVLEEMDDTVVEIGMNPKMLHLFVNLKNGQAVKDFKIATIFRDRVYAKGVTYWKKTEAPTPTEGIPSEVRYAYKKGGLMSRTDSEPRTI